LSSSHIELYFSRSSFTGHTPVVNRRSVAITVILVSFRKVVCCVNCLSDLVIHYIISSLCYLHFFKTVSFRELGMKISSLTCIIIMPIYIFSSLFIFNFVSTQFLFYMYAWHCNVFSASKSSLCKVALSSLLINLITLFLVQFLSPLPKVCCTSNVSENLANTSHNI
jgi:hypothetical protein